MRRDSAASRFLSILLALTLVTSFDCGATITYANASPTDAAAGQVDSDASAGTPDDGASDAADTPGGSGADSADQSGSSADAATTATDSADASNAAGSGSSASGTDSATTPASAADGSTDASAAAPSTVADKQDYQDATFAIGFADESNRANRRPDDLRSLIKLTADGSKVDLSAYTVTQASDEPVRIGDVEFYFFTIKDLPVYNAVLTDAVSYQLSQKASLIKGYQGMPADEAAAAFDADGLLQAIDSGVVTSENASAFVDSLAGPKGTLALSSTDGAFGAKAAFVNYLKFYDVTATITWPTQEAAAETGEAADANDGENAAAADGAAASDDTDEAMAATDEAIPLPDRVSYLASAFTATQGDDAYSALRVEYDQTQQQDNAWTVTLKGLAATDASGDAAAYQVSLAVPQGFACDDPAVEVKGDAALTFAMRVGTDAEAGIMPLDEAEEPATHEIEASTSVTWYDTTGRAVNAHQGAFSGVASGWLQVTFTRDNDESYQLDPKGWKWVEDESSSGGHYEYTYTADDADALGVEEGKILTLTDDGDNSLARTLNVKAEVGTQVTGVSIGLDATAVDRVDYGKGDAANTLPSVDARIAKYLPSGKDGSYIIYPLTRVYANINVRAGDDIKTPEVTEDFTDRMTIAFSWNGTEYGGDGTTPSNGNANNIVEGEDVAAGHVNGLLDKWEEVVATFGKLGIALDHNRNGVNYTPPTFDNDPSTIPVIEYYLPLYDSNKTEVVYFQGSRNLTEDEKRSDHFVAEYDNTQVPGHGTETNVVYNGGTARFTRVGVTTFNASKDWADESNATERPDISWTLWRYAQGRGDYTSAAQVFTDNDGKALTMTAKAPTGGAAQGVVAENGVFQADPAFKSDVDLSIEGLPKYDVDGYPYVYFLRESCKDSSYTQFYGQIDQTQAAFIEEDVLPYDGDRASDDRSLYNGGAIQNRKEDTVSVTAAKKWVAAYYQDSFEDLKVEMTLQRKLKSAGDEAWEPVALTAEEAPGATLSDEGALVLDNFSAADAIQSKTLTMPRFDDEGREYEYRFVESDVIQTVGGEDVSATWREQGNEATTSSSALDGLLSLVGLAEGDESDASVSGTFTLPLNQATLDANSMPDSDEYFVSSSQTTYDEDAGYSTLSTNTLEGVTSYWVKKTWAADLAPEDITVTLEATAVSSQEGLGKQNVDINVSADDPTQATFSKPYPKGGQTSPETAGKFKYGGSPDTGYDSGWQELYTNLPAYDEEGGLIEYVVREVNGGHVSNYTYGANIDDDEATERYVVKIDNSGPGIVRTVDVRKVWLDDSATTNRDTVYFSVTADAVDDRPVVLYGSDNDAVFGGPVSVAAGDEWWKRIDVTLFTYKTDVGTTTYTTRTDEVPADAYDKDVFGNLAEWQQEHLYRGSVSVTEVSLGGTPVDTSNTTGQQYPIAIKTDANGTEQARYAVIYNHDKNGDAAADSNYDSTNIEDADGYYTVINRRVGRMSLEVTKQWSDDGYEANAEDRQKASLTLSGDDSSGYGPTVEDDEHGVGTVTVPVNAPNQDATSAIAQILQHEEPGVQYVYNSESDGAKQISITQQLGQKTDDNTEKVAYANLPLYDAYGRIMHYKVTENFSNEDNHYVPVYGDIYHGALGDTASDMSVAQTITNTRRATKEYSWHMLWLDDYMSNQGWRPDVYLNVFRTAYDEDGKQIIESQPFMEYLWNQTHDNGQDFWTATFELPQYDDQGREIQYYAIIQSHADAADRDYIAPQLATDATDSLEKFQGGAALTAIPGESNGDYKLEYTDSDEVKEQKVTVGGKEYTVHLLKEGNTFVSQLKESVVINGQKIWEALPQGFPEAELPALTFKLYRSTGMNTGAADSGTTAGQETNDKVLVGIIEGYKSTSTEGDDSGYTYSFVLKHVGFNDEKGDLVTGVDGQDEAHWTESLADNGQIEDLALYGSVLPKYDPQGQMYQYTIVETMAADDAEDIANVAYEKLDGAVNGYNIINTFNKASNKTSLTVVKSWKEELNATPRGDGSSTGTGGNPEDLTGNVAYPDTTYTLYRAYQLTSSDTVKYSTPEVVATQTLKGEDVATSSQVTFKDLSIWAPNFKPYLYFVVESQIDGYNNSTNTGCVFTIDGINVKKIELAEGASWQDAFESDTGPYPGMDVWTSGAFELTASRVQGNEDNTPATIKATNTYTGLKQVGISGSKIWNDGAHDNPYGTRPETLKLKLCRQAEGGIAKEKVADITLEVLYGSAGSSATLKGYSDADPSYAQNITHVLANEDVKLTVNEGSWNFTVSKLDGYAPNGQAYQYSVEEDLDKDSHYQATTGTIGPSSQLDDKRMIALGALENTNLGRLKVTKAWNGANDSTVNPELAMPEVVVELQVKDDKTGTWQWASDYFNGLTTRGGTTLVYDDNAHAIYCKGPDGTGHLSGRLFNTQATMIGTGDEYNVARIYYLPQSYVEKDGTTHTLTYRAAEISIGGVAVEYGMGNDGKREVDPVRSNDGKTTGGTSYVISTGEPEDWDEDGVISSLSNETDLTSLTVTKKWQNDQDNLFDTRGGAASGSWSVHFRLYRSYGEGDNAKVEALPTVAGYDPVVTLSGTNADPSASMTIDGLPKTTPDGQVYTYYAVELDANSEVSIDDSGKGIYVGNGVYESLITNTSPAEDSADLFTTEAINTLKTTSVTIQKKWDDNGLAALRPTEDGLKLTIHAADSLYPNTEIAAMPWIVKVGQTAGSEWKAVDDTWQLTTTITEETAKSNIWTVVAEGLPAANYLQHDYTFWVTEDRQLGYEEPEITGAASKQTITNNAIEFTLDKVSADGTSLSGVTLVFTSTGPVQDDDFARLIWTRDDAGTRYSVSYGPTQGVADDAALKTELVSGSAAPGDTLKITGLPVGTYRLTSEQAPLGYTAKALGETFILSEKGDVSAAADNTYIAAGSGSVDLQVENDKSSITLTKTDNKGNDIAEGYAFKVSGVMADSKGAVADRYLVAKADKGNVAALGLPEDAQLLESGDLVVGESYALTEERAPLGYQRNVNTAKFSIEKDGTITLTDDANGAASASGMAITFKDQSFDVTVKKVSSEDADATLKGATFKLYTASQAADNEWRQVGEPFTTDDQGTADLPALQVGATYQLVEDSAPAGYEVTTGKDSCVFEVNPDGTLTMNQDGDGTFAFDGTTMSITAEDTPIVVQLKKVAVGDDSETGLSGAVFTVSGVFAGDTDSSTKTLDATDADGAVTLPEGLVANRTYTLTEITAPAGYRLAGSVEFTVKADGTVTLVGADAQGVADGSRVAGQGEPSGSYRAGVADDGTVTITAFDRAVGIDLTKRNLDGTTVLPSGYAFKVSGVMANSNGTVVDRYIVAEADKGKLAELVPNAQDATLLKDGDLMANATYTLSEVTAPAGYELAGLVKFTVADDGTIELAGDASDGSGTYAVNDDAITIAANDAPIELSVKKVAVGDSTYMGLPNAAFTLSGTFVSGKTELKLTTGKDGMAVVPAGELIAGNAYTLSEDVAPAGYELAGSVEFTVNADGTVVLGAATGDGSGDYVNTSSDKGVVITATDAPVEAKVMKVNADGIEALPGAVFELTIKKTGDPVGEGSFTTDADGVALLPSAQLVAGETYVLTEATAPAGYETSGSVEFTVDSKGEVSLGTVTGAQDAFKAEVDNGTVVFTVTDNPIEAALKKVSSWDGSTLSGAVFTVSGQFADSDSPGVKTLTVENGTATFESGTLIANNTYELTEITAPAGYELAGSVKFTVRPNGEIVLDDARADGTAPGLPVKGQGTPTGTYRAGIAADGTVTITAADMPIEVSFKKVDKDSDASLPGAVFTLTDANGATVGQGAYTTDASGVVRLDAALLSAGETYYLTETAPPAGYTLPAENLRQAAITVNDDGTVSVAQQGNVFDVPDGDVVVVNDSSFSVEIVKRGSAGFGYLASGIEGSEGLAGAVFSLERKADDGTGWSLVADGLTTGKAGTLTLDGIELGLEVGAAYRLTETTPPAGYALQQDSYEFTFNEDGTLSWVDETAVPESAQIEADGTVLAVTDEPVEAALVKLSDDGATPLDGVSFELYRVGTMPIAGSGGQQTAGSALGSGVALADSALAGTDSDPVAVLTTGADGRLVFAADGVPILEAGGIYCLVESGVGSHTDHVFVPYGVAARFMVGADGSITLDRLSSPEFSLAAATADAPATFTVTNHVNHLAIAKVDEEGAALDGAKLALYAADDFDMASGKPYGSAVPFDSWVTDAQAPAHEMSALPAGRYVLFEAEAPEGYEAFAPLAITVAPDGTVLLDDEQRADASLGEDGVTVTVVDSLTPVEKVVRKLPKTGDNLIIVIVAGMVAILGAAGVVGALRRSRRDEQ